MKNINNIVANDLPLNESLSLNTTYNTMIQVINKEFSQIEDVTEQVEQEPIEFSTSSTQSTSASCISNSTNVS